MLTERSTVEAMATAATEMPDRRRRDWSSPDGPVQRYGRLSAVGRDRPGLQEGAARIPRATAPQDDHRRMLLGLPADQRRIELLGRGCRATAAGAAPRGSAIEGPRRIRAPVGRGTCAAGASAVGPVAHAVARVAAALEQWGSAGGPKPGQGLLAGACGSGWDSRGTPAPSESGLDEPTNGLDNQAHIEVRGLLLAAPRGTTVSSQAPVGRGGETAPVSGYWTAAARAPGPAGDPHARPGRRWFTARPRQVRAPGRRVTSIDGDG